MNPNYQNIESFLNLIKNISVFYPEINIDKNFIYSNLLEFGIQNNEGRSIDVKNLFEYWLIRFQNNDGINVDYYDSRPNFLWFTNGKINGNEIKLYIPLDINHLYEGANQLFDFISSIGIEHESKIASIIRNDNIVVRVNNQNDMNKIINYVNSNPYIMEGLLKTNPFLFNYKGLGITMDNSYSYNATVCNLIAEYVSYLKSIDQLNTLNAESFNAYVRSKIEFTEDQDLKDILAFIERTTSKDLSMNDINLLINIKSINRYTSDRKRIEDPIFYFEQAVILTNTKNPDSTKKAIISYLKGNPEYFTNDDRARDGLTEYVHPSDVIPIMRRKLSENSIEIPHTDSELIDTYLSTLINPKKSTKTH